MERPAPPDQIDSLEVVLVNEVASTFLDEKGQLRADLVAQMRGPVGGAIASTLNLRATRRLVAHSETMIWWTRVLAGLTVALITLTSVLVWRTFF